MFSQKKKSRRIHVLSRHNLAFVIIISDKDLMTWLEEIYSNDGQIYDIIESIQSHSEVQGIGGLCKYLILHRFTRPHSYDSMDW